MNKNQLTTIWAIVFILIPSVLSAKSTLVIPNPPNLFTDDEKRSPQELIKVLKQTIKDDPKNYKNYGMLAFAYDYIGDYKNELEAVKLEVSLLPEDIEERDVFYGNLARAYFLNDQWKEGKDWLDKADNINPGNFYNRWNAFDYYLIHEKDYRAAVSQLNRLKEFYEENQDQYYEAYTKSLRNWVEHKDIIKLFELAVELEPHNNKIHRTLGIAIRNSSTEDYEKNMPFALKEFEKALELDSKYIPTYISIADTYMLLGFRTNKEEDYEKALEWFNKALEIKPDDSKLAFAMGNFYFSRKDYDKAIEKLEFAYTQDPDDYVKDVLAKAYNNKADSFYRTGEKLDQGLNLINKAIELDPQSGIILGTKAELLYEIGNFSEAYKYIKMALEIMPDHEELKQDLKMIEEALNKK